MSDSTDGCAARLDRTTPDERKKETEVGGRSTVPAGRHVPSFLELRISFYGSQLFWGRRFRPPPFCGKGGTSVPSLLSLLFPNRGVKRFGSLRLPPTGSRKDRIRDRSRRRLLSCLILPPTSERQPLGVQPLGVQRDVGWGNFPRTPRLYLRVKFWYEGRETDLPLGLHPSSSSFAPRAPVVWVLGFSSLLALRPRSLFVHPTGGSPRPPPPIPTGVSEKFRGI